MNKEKPYYSSDMAVILNTYRRIPLEIVKGDGVHLITKDGKRYLDFFSGLAVNALGYNHPKITGAINNQLSRYVHLSNYYINDPQVQLAELLVKYSYLAGVFFTNSGTEAVEAAIKLIRKAFGPEKNILSLTDSFHGRTYGALSLTGRPKYREPFLPLLPKINQIKFNDVKDLKEKTDNNTAAVFLEFIQGEGGINLLSNQFVSTLIDLKSKYNFAIIADEVQSGLGRTGKPFSFNYYNINPDIVITAKSLGGGLPLGAMITNKNYSNVFSFGDHGSTFGGNPVACAAGVAVIEEIFENKLYEDVYKLGNYFLSELELLRQKFPAKIAEVRGRGFMIGVEMNINCIRIVEALRIRRVLVNCTSQKVIRILPPLITVKEEIDFFLYTFDEVLREHQDA